MSLGFDQNNPGNLRTGSTMYQGEIASTNGFRNFSSMPYGIRAWVYNLYTQITIHGHNTYGAYLTAYAPVSDGNASTYPSDVVGSDFNLNDPILLDSVNLEKFFYDQIKVEIGADDAANVQDSDFQSGLQMFNSSVPGVFLTTAAAAANVAPTLPSNYFVIISSVVLFGILLLLIYTATKQR